MRICVVLLCGVLLGCNGVESEKARRLAAFGKCQVELIRTSNSPESAQVEYVEPRVTAERYEFAWRLAQGVRVSERLGFPLEADCHVGQESQKIEYLRLGEQILIRRD